MSANLDISPRGGERYPKFTTVGGGVFSLGFAATVQAAVATTATSDGMTFSEAIYEALLKCQGQDQDEPVEPAALEQGLRVANNILRSWQTRGLHQWRRQEVVLPLNVGQVEYFLGDGTDSAYWADEEDFFSTTVATAAVAAATTLVLTDAGDYVNADFVGIELSDGTRQWTTATKSSNTLTLAAALTANVSANASVYFFTARPSRPLRAIHARRRSSIDSADIPVRIEAHNFYRDQPMKNSNGTVVHVYYQPVLGTYGKLFVWQPSNSVTQQLRLTVERKFTIGTSGADTIDIPDEWNDAFIYRIAVRLEPTFGHLDGMRVKHLRDDADRLEADALGFDDDTGSIYFAPSRRR